ncbi:ABC transporter substrate-binding protein [Streptosporangium carneum]|uniref:Glutathione ABC transporter substrate-binding protein n=1 Tax=Streptosporangium carneum TaxID=47481 RepID=A0A9W6MGC1_9ACTN|nr:ABC transporter substrate-binding protein [Streptosporangium carneum]GLK12763.1 glutathione ABC transporter substrate-binding protein [Streptosporangium carneum]
MTKHHGRALALRAAVVACTTAVVATGCSQPRSSTADAGVTVAETTAPTTLDPQGSAFFADRFAWQLAYECLLTTTADGKVEPALASGYERSKDGLTYTFSLRPNVKFHNGEALTADDVVYTFTRLKESPDGIDKALFPTLEETVAKDATTVEFHLKSPDAGFVNNMANPLVWGCAVMSKKAATTGNAAVGMVGTGPWKQESYRANSELKLTRFDGYWGDKTKSERLNILYVPNVSTQVSNLKADKVDLIFPDVAGAKALSGSDKLTVDKAPTDSTIFLQVNNLTKPFDNEKVRQALALALDRDSLAQQAYSGAARASVYIPPGTAWAPKPADLPNSTQDIEKAKQLLREAGYPDGFSTSLMYISGYDPGTNNLVAAMQDQLAKAGIKVELDPLEGGAWGAKLTKPDFALSWNAQSYYSNPFQYVQPAEGRQGPVPASLQKLLDEALKAESQEAYQQALIAIEKEEARTVYPTITLLATDMFVAYKKGMSGVAVPPSQSRTFLSQVSHG